MSQPGPFWTVALRRQPVRIVGGEPEGGYTDAYELICCDCGDSPELDYLDVAPEVQLVRGPYPLPAGVTAYVSHVQRYHALVQVQQHEVLEQDHRDAEQRRH